MARKKPQPEVPDTLKNLVQDVGKPVSSSDVDSYGKLRQIQDRSHQIRTIVKAWKDQQAQDRKMRERYATYLIVAMGAQALVVNVVFVLLGCGLLTFEAWTARTFIVNVVFVLLGCGLLTFEAWTARTFIMSVFAEIAAMVLIVVKYLFTPSSEKVLQFLGEKKRARGKGR